MSRANVYRLCRNVLRYAAGPGKQEQRENVRYMIAVPREVAETFPPDTLFRCEQTETGFSFRELVGKGE